MSKSLSQMSNEELWQLFPIIIKEHDSRWAQWYKEEEAHLRRIIGKESIERINHIGSTAVKGLAAKPTVDILLEVRRDADLEKLKSSLEQNGYIFTPQPDTPPPQMMFLKGYTSQGFGEKVFHLHVRFPRDWDELYFRDYLRLHADVARDYGCLKHKLKETFEHDRDGYTEAKTDFVQRYSALAREELGGRYAPENTVKNCCSVGIIGGADGPTTVFITEPKSRKKRKQRRRDKLQREWQSVLEACKQQATPVPRIKNADELKAYLIEAFGAKETEPMPSQILSLKINALMNCHPEVLQSPDMPEENADKQEWIQWAQQSHLDYCEAARLLPDDIYGFRYAFLSIPRNDATNAFYIERDNESRNIKKKFGLKTKLKPEEPGDADDEEEPDITLDIELSTCQISMGNGCAKLMNELTLWRGITQDDIDNQTAQFMAYAAAMRDTGQLKNV